MSTNNALGTVLGLAKRNEQDSCLHLQIFSKGDKLKPVNKLPCVTKRYEETERAVTGNSRAGLSWEVAFVLQKSSPCKEQGGGEGSIPQRRTALKGPRWARAPCAPRMETKPIQLSTVGGEER